MSNITPRPPTKLSFIYFDFVIRTFRGDFTLVVARGADCTRLPFVDDRASTGLAVLDRERACVCTYVSVCVSSPLSAPLETKREKRRRIFAQTNAKDGERAEKSL